MAKSFHSEDVSLFEDSLGTLFGHVQPCLSEPGQLFDFQSAAFGKISIKVPPQASTQLFAHYVWRASMRMADDIGADALDLRGERVLELLSAKTSSLFTIIAII